MDCLSYILAFCVILLNAKVLKAMRKDKPKGPVILVSFDGLGWKALESNLTKTPNFDFIAKSGVKAKNLIGVHPVKTFPIHTTFLTGLYPESHGIVDNKFWDPKYLSKFIMEHDCSNFDPKYYNESEPIWKTLEKRGRRTAAYYWPGSTSYGQNPSFYAQEFCNIDCDKYTGPMMMEYLRLYFRVHCFFNWAKSYQRRIDTIVDEWLMSDDPPELVLLYIEEPDLEGHKNGPSSKEYLKKIESLDKDVLGYLLSRLKDRKLIESANVIVVSDHGMVETKHTRQIRLHDYITPASYFNNIAAREHIWPKPGKFQEVYTKLKAAKNPHFKVYKKADIPQRLNFKNHRRIPPIYLVIDEGWLMRPDWNALAEGEWVEGTHGWPPTENSAGIFYARGPAFKRDYSSPRSAHAIDIYSLLCYLLDEEPLPNNGTIVHMVDFLRGNETYNFSKLWPYEVSIRNKIKNIHDHEEIIRPERPKSKAPDGREPIGKPSTVSKVLATRGLTRELAVLAHLPHKTSITHSFNPHMSQPLTITNRHELTTNPSNSNALQEKAYSQGLRSHTMKESIAVALQTLSAMNRKTTSSNAAVHTTPWKKGRSRDFVVTPASSAKIKAAAATQTESETTISLTTTLSKTTLSTKTLSKTNLSKTTSSETTITTLLDTTAALTKTKADAKTARKKTKDLKRYFSKANTLTSEYTTKAPRITHKMATVTTTTTATTTTELLTYTKIHTTTSNRLEATERPTRSYNTLKQTILVFPSTKTLTIRKLSLTDSLRKNTLRNTPSLRATQDAKGQKSRDVKYETNRQSGKKSAGEEVRPNDRTATVTVTVTVTLKLSTTFTVENTPSTAHRLYEKKHRYDTSEPMTPKYKPVRTFYPVSTSPTTFTVENAPSTAIRPYEKNHRYGKSESMTPTYKPVRTFYPVSTSPTTFTVENAPSTANRPYEKNHRYDKSEATTYQPVRTFYPVSTSPTTKGRIETRVSLQRPFQRAQLTTMSTLTEYASHSIPATKYSLDKNTLGKSDSILSKKQIQALKEIFTKVDTTMKPTPMNLTGNNITEILRILALSNNRSRSSESKEQDWFKDCPPLDEPEWKPADNQQNTNNRPMNQATAGSLSCWNALLITFIALRLLVMDVK